MKNVKRILPVFMICALMMLAFTGCHSHNPEWRIDKDSHWKECSCGEISEKGEHSFELEICTVCGTERKAQEGLLTDMCLYNEYGDWVQILYFDEEENLYAESEAEYNYDKNGNKLSERMYDDGVLITSCEYDYDSNGLTYRKYETEHMEDGSKTVIEYNEHGDNLGSISYDAEGKQTESYRSEYITDDEGELIGEKVYENDILTKEMKYAEGNDGGEEYLYITEMTEYSQDGTKRTEIYNENGEVIKEIAYNEEGEKLYAYDLEYLYDDEENLTAIEKKEKGVVRQKIVYEYDDDGGISAEKTYEGDRLIKEAFYSEGENFFYESKIIIYNEDGTSTVEEYNENGEMIG